jgi:hypothetical protein
MGARRGNTGAICFTPACYAGNPLNGGQCYCPPGFTDQVMQVLDDTACSTPPNPPYGWAVHACVGGTPNAAADFGGVFQQNRNRGCNTANAFTGVCACPAGFSGIELPHNGGCYERVFTTVCFNASAPRSTLAGAYVVSDGGACRSGNPATGTCSCPAGSSPQQMRAIYGPATTDCRRDNQFGANLVFCSVP